MELTIADLQAALKGAPLAPVNRRGLVRVDWVLAGQNRLGFDERADAELTKRGFGDFIPRKDRKGRG